MSSPAAEQPSPQPSKPDIGAAALRSVGRVFGVVLGVTFLVGLAVCWWAGLFDSVELETRMVGPWHTVQRLHKGPYDNIRFVIRGVVMYTQRATGAKPTRGFAVFLDEPLETGPAGLRSVAGCIVDSLIAQPDTPYVSATVGEFEAVVGTFRLRSFLSYMTGVFKFYPALSQHLADNNLELAGPVVELYDLENRIIEYIAPLSNPPFVPDTIPAAVVVEE